MDDLRIRLTEYVDSLRSVYGQMNETAIAIEFRYGKSANTEPLRDGMKLYSAIADDLQKLLDGKELQPFVITGVI